MGRPLFYRPSFVLSMTLRVYFTGISKSHAGHSRGNIGTAGSLVIDERNTQYATTFFLHFAQRKYCSSRLRHLESLLLYLIPLLHLQTDIQDGANDPRRSGDCQGNSWKQLLLRLWNEKSDMGQC
jgi:hypothetical protein